MHISLIFFTQFSKIKQAFETKQCRIYEYRICRIVIMPYRTKQSSFNKSLSVVKMDWINFHEGVCKWMKVFIV